MLIAVATCAAALSGCLNQAPPDNNGVGAPAAGAVTDRNSAGVPLRPDERRRVADAYRRFWAVAVALDRQPPERWRETLSAVAGDPILGDLLDGYTAQRSQGTVSFGSVVPRPEVVDLRPGRASVLDCQDASASGELDLESGEVKEVGSPRTPVAAVLRTYDGARWRVTELRYLDQPC